MKNSLNYFTINGVDIAMIGKSGSSAIGRAMLLIAQPDFTIVSGSGNTELVEKMWNSPGIGQGSAPKTTTATNPVIPVRDPVERFRSACAQDGKTAEEALELLEGGKFNFHFRPTSNYLVEGDNRLFLFPAHLPEIAKLLNLPEIPSVNDNSNNIPKPTLTPKQIKRVKAIYAADIALFNSITEAGHALAVSPPEPEPEPIHTPQTVSARQLRLALSELGKLATVEGMITNPQTPETMKIEWEYATSFDRSNSTLGAAAQMLSWTDDYVDEIFILAATK